MPSPMTPLLTTKDVMETLRISRSTVDRLRRGGHLAWVRVGGGVRYSQGSVECLLRRGASPSAHDPCQQGQAPSAVTSKPFPSVHRVA
jgi:predicted DNA-binding transcriptional regulator AlpA